MTIKLRQSTLMGDGSTSFSTALRRLLARPGDDGQKSESPGAGTPGDDNQ
jgi:hypothetical protein